MLGWPYGVAAAQPYGLKPSAQRSSSRSISFRGNSADLGIAIGCAQLTLVRGDLRRITKVRALTVANVNQEFGFAFI